MDKAESASPIAELVCALARRMGRSSSDITPVLEKLRDNWIDTLWNWAGLTRELKLALGLPAALVLELDRMQPSQENQMAWLHCSATSLSLTLGGILRYEVKPGAALSVLFEMIGEEGCCFYTPDAVKVAPSTPVCLAVVPNGLLVAGKTTYKIAPGPHPTAVFNWLSSIHMSQYSGAFSAHSMDDFLALPFVSEAALTAIGVTDASHVSVIMKAVNELRACTPIDFLGHWLRHFGCDASTVQSFRERNIDLHSLLEQSPEALLSGCAHPENGLREMIDVYKSFSSVEETFHWLRRSGFEKYAFHFARYNIPFYALPCVNFFIIDEMGVTNDDQLLLQALHALKACPQFDVRAVAFWLRDLELEKYGVVFASNGLTTLHALTLLSDDQIERIVESPNDRLKLQTGILEMKEFQFYYLATASLLQELGMERYSQLFALHGTSIDVLPFLSEKQLIEMGITSKADRKKILSAIEKIKQEIPYQSNLWAQGTLVPSQGGSMSVMGKGPRSGPAGGMGGAGITNNNNNNSSSSNNNNNNNNNSASSSPNNSGSSAASRSTTQASSPASRQNFSEDKSLEELLNYVYGNSKASDVPGSSSSSARKKGRKKNKKAPSGASSPATVPPPPPSSTSSSTSSTTSTTTTTTTTTVKVTESETPSPMKSSVMEPKTPPPEEREIELAPEELDPALKKQVDSEVEEFRRRLEAAGQSTKAKLTPIFYLGVDEKKRSPSKFL